MPYPFGKPFGDFTACNSQKRPKTSVMISGFWNFTINFFVMLLVVLVVFLRYQVQVDAGDRVYVTHPLSFLASLGFF